MTMPYTRSNQRKTLRIICILFVTVGLVSSLSVNVSGQETLTLSVNRNIGIGFFNYISGSFTLHGSGPDTIQNLTVYFNDVEVHFETGNTVSWQFNTADYEGGSTSITLIGIDNTGGIHSASQHVVIINEALTGMVTIVVAILIIVLLLAKYGPRLMKMRNK